MPLLPKKAGLKNAEQYIDATTITSQEELERAVAECSVFGRVTPQQKKGYGAGIKGTGPYGCHDR